MRSGLGLDGLEERTIGVKGMPLTIGEVHKSVKLGLNLLRIPQIAVSIQQEFGEVFKGIIDKAVNSETGLAQYVVSDLTSVVLPSQINNKIRVYGCLKIIIPNISHNEIPMEIPTTLG